MESPQRENHSSMGNAASSTADSTPADSTPPQTISPVSKSPPLAKMDATVVVDNDDSDSDVSMSTETDEEDNPELSPSAVQLHSGLKNSAQPNGFPVSIAEEGSKKRKYSDATLEISNGYIDNDISQEVRKRMKPDGVVSKHRNSEGRLLEDKSLLPAEIWHRIFTFCPPKVLGPLLQVNKSFNAYLEPSSPYLSTVHLPKSGLQTLQPDAIWRASRLRIGQGIPGPLMNKSEPDMWKMACGSVCQFCGKKGASTAPTDQWHPGPGEIGVQPVWLFGIRACGSCLEQKSMKEIDLLLSSSIPSPLMAALPFIFLTNELHVLPPSTLQNGQQPSTVQITKRFLNAQVEEIKQEFERVKTLGPAATEEWLKGLEDRGKEIKSDSARWERWDASKGVVSMRNWKHIGGGEVNNCGVSSTENATATQESTMKVDSQATNGISPIFQYQPPNAAQTARSFPPYQAHRLPQSTRPNFPPNLPPRFDSPSQNGFAPFPPPRAYPQPKHERTKEEVTQLKAARRAEIERRCMLLDPPLTAGVLAHMASFQAAIQIIQPLTDSAWEVLKPRLLSQREEAEQRENDRLAQTRVVQERFDERRFQDVQIKPEAKDMVDREWDDIQAPLRARISGYADEIIRDGWNGGDKVNYENCPKFAADVLIYVRKRFYAEVAKDEAAVRATGQEPEMDPPNGPYLRKLILENMKWVFDTKVKPHTEQYRKELFLCNACESNPKYYGFEGVVQHYAAKHTSALSVGSIVVHWKSEWPEYPPFNPDPTAVTNPSYYATAPSASVPYSSNGTLLQQNYGFGGYQPAPVSAPMQAPMQAPHPHGYQESPGPYYGHPQFGDQYSGHQNGPYPPPQSYQDPSQAYQTPQYSTAPPPSNIGYHEAPQEYSHQGYSGAYPASSQGMYTSPNQGQLYPAPVPELPIQQATYNPQGNQYENGHNQPVAYPNNGFAQAPAPVPQKTEEYKIQLQGVARNARDVWNTINPIKEVPGSVKVYTIIYHLLKRFRETSQDDPPLSMIIDGLSNNKEMRPVRNINGLLCKACTLGMAASKSAPPKKHFSFPQLVNHFHSIHEQGLSQTADSYLPDWKRDMVELPDLSKLRSFMNGSGKDDQRLNLITEAIPDIISPLVADFEDVRDCARPVYENTDHGSYTNLAPSQDNHDKYYAPTAGSKPSDSGGILYDSGEYDPRNPRDLPTETRPLYKAARPNGDSYERNLGDPEPLYRFTQHTDDRRESIHRDRSEPSYPEYRPISQHSQLRPSGEYERVIIREDAPIYIDRRIRYREPDDAEYRVRREPHGPVYEEVDPLAPGRTYRVQNAEAHEANRHAIPLSASRDVQFRDDRSRLVEDPIAPQNRLFEVVAQISQQAQQARARLPPQEEPAEAGSEDGEVRVQPGSRPDTRLSRPPDEASDAAERFLNNFLPGGPVVEAVSNTNRRQAEEGRTKWESERNDDGVRRTHQPPDESRSRLRDDYGGNEAPTRRGHPTDAIVNDAEHNGYVVHDRPPPGSRAYPYEGQYGSSAPEQIIQRERSPELVDRRYKLNDVVYRDERQTSHGTHRTPSRYARWARNQGNTVTAVPLLITYTKNLSIAHAHLSRL
ncbi:hypothetical protein G7Y89_g15371 [Cudoniella acicularis]|uniref:DUF7892 domain-containing protein n=1 Tax=Cudoniella acicularis TaxID=354080 RepID=A0A8H4VKP7_9HELO|nr:hypothetical protein G7Y89_g15371 [Cudoniella acicularis]